MISGSKGHTFHARMKKCNLGSMFPYTFSKTYATIFKTDENTWREIKWLMKIKLKKLMGKK